MGVPFIFYYFNKKYNNQILLTDINVDNIYFDYNSLIHPCVKYAEEKTDDGIIEEVCKYTKFVLSKITYKNAYIVIDGVAPRSKMVQQRERRFKSICTQKSWDTNQITPGTGFMKSLKIRLEKEFGAEFVSASDCPGEGEHKIMKMMTENDVIGKKCCIYGLDADLIFLSLIHKNADNIILLRDSDNTMTKPLYVDIKLLKKQICKDIFSRNEFMKILSCEQIIKDYMFLCIFFGNDFLKSIPGLSIKENGVEYIINMYLAFVFKKKRGILMQNDLLIQDLKFLFVYMSKTEDSIFRKNRTRIELPDDIKQMAGVYTNEDISIRNKECYYMYYGIKKHKLQDACEDYIRGIYWILGYYFNHRHNNWSWYYKYSNTPFPSDLAYACNNMENISFEQDACVSEKEQLYLVLPKSSLENSDVIQYLESYYYPDLSNIYVDLVNKHHSWEGIVFFRNNINIDIIKLFI